MGGRDQIMELAAEMGARHAVEPGRWKLSGDDVLRALGVEDPGDDRYVIIAAYEDAHDIARAEAGPGEESWPQPISRAHKLWLRSNLVNHAGLAEMLRVSAHRIYKESVRPGWPEPVIDRPRRHWHWWPHLEPGLAAAGLRLPPGVTPPAGGPAPSWWGDLPARPDFTYYLRGNLMNFTRFADEYNLDRAAILHAGKYPDYPEPIIGRPANYWYWWPDLDRFLVRQPEIHDLAVQVRTRATLPSAPLLDASAWTADTLVGAAIPRTTHVASMTVGTLQYQGIDTLGDLARKTDEELKAVPRIGPGGMRVIREVLDAWRARQQPTADRGLAGRQERPPQPAAAEFPAASPPGEQARATAPGWRRIDASGQIGGVAPEWEAET